MRSLQNICLKNKTDNKTKNKMRQIKTIIFHLSPKKNQKTFREKLYFETSNLRLDLNLQPGLPPFAGAKTGQKI